MECVVSNVVNQKPKGDEWRLHAPGAVAEGMRQLHALAIREEPSLVITLGEQAFHAMVFGDPDAAKFRITDIRGYCFDSPFGKVLATVHPAFVLRAWHPWWALLSLDLQKARRLRDEYAHGVGGGASTERREVVVTDPSKLPAITERPTAIDIETDGALGIACVGWSDTREIGYCAPYREDFLDFFHALLDSSAAKIFQNGAFDTTILQRHGFTITNWAHDTMLLHHTLSPILAGKVTLGDASESGAKQTHKSLKFLASIYTDEPYWKIYEYENQHDQFVLCAKDSRVTLEIWEKMHDRLEDL